MITFDLNGHSYSARTLNVFDQMLMAKRIMPLAKTILTPEVLAMVLAAPSGKPGEDGKSEAAKALGEKLKADISGVVGALADAIYALSDDDAMFVVNKCLAVTQRKSAGGVYTAITTDSGNLMFDDIKLPDLVGIAAKVVGGHLQDFFSIAP